MSEGKYKEIMNNIDKGKYHLYFKGDKKDFLRKLKTKRNRELTKEEYESIVNYVEMITEPIPDCIWEAMVECNPDLID